MKVELDDELYGKFYDMTQRFTVPIATMVNSALREWLELHETELSACEESRRRVEEAKAAHQQNLEKMRTMLRGGQPQGQLAL